MLETSLSPLHYTIRHQLSKIRVRTGGGRREGIRPSRDVENILAEWFETKAKLGLGGRGFLKLVTLHNSSSTHSRSSAVHQRNERVNDVRQIVRTVPNEITVSLVRSTLLLADSVKAFDDERTEKERKREGEKGDTIRISARHERGRRGERERERERESRSRPCTSSDSVICRHGDAGKASRRLSFWIIYGHRLHEDGVTAGGQTPGWPGSRSETPKVTFSYLTIATTNGIVRGWAVERRRQGRKPFSISLAFLSSGSLSRITARLGDQNSIRNRVRGNEWPFYQTLPMGSRWTVFSFAFFPPFWSTPPERKLKKKKKTNQRVTSRK